MQQYLGDYFKTLFQAEKLSKISTSLGKKIDTLCEIVDDLVSKVYFASGDNEIFITASLQTINQTLLEITHIYSSFCQSVANHDAICNIVGKFLLKYSKMQESGTGIEILLTETSQAVMRVVEEINTLMVAKSSAENTLRNMMGELGDAVTVAELKIDGLSEVIVLSDSTMENACAALDVLYEPDVCADLISKELELLESNPNKIFFRCFSLLRKNNLLPQDILKETDNHPAKTVMDIAFSENLFDLENPVDRNIVDLQKYAIGLDEYANSFVSEDIPSDIFGIIESCIINTECLVTEKFHGGIHDFFANKNIRKITARAGQCDEGKPLLRGNPVPKNFFRQGCPQ